MFPFPSNGKVYSKSLVAQGKDVVYTPQLSIPFKRERVFKVEKYFPGSDPEDYDFPFPSNGKGYSKNIET